MQKCYKDYKVDHSKAEAEDRNSENNNDWGVTGGVWPKKLGLTGGGSKEAIIQKFQQMEERDKVQVEAKSLLKERNSENNNEWGTKSLLKERKEEVDHSKAEAKGATFSPKSLLCSQVTEYAFA